MSGNQIRNNVTPGTYEEVQKSAEFLLSRTTYRPKIGIICGSGLGGMANLLEKAQAFPFSEIPNFEKSTAPGHKGQLMFGSLGNNEVLCMQGRLHLYEGYQQDKVTFPIRVMKLIGVKLLVITNAAGGLNPEYEIGDLVIIKDHINLPGLVGLNPLIGPNDERFGPRFPPLSKAYSREYVTLAKEVAREMRLDFVKEGVYIAQTGPSYETIAECHLFRQFGADLMGMSTASEVVVASHMGMDVFAMSIVTNLATLDYDSSHSVDGHKVIKAANNRANVMSSFIARLLEKVNF